MRALPLPTKQANAECFEPKDTEAEYMRCFTLLQFRSSPTSPSNAPKCDQVYLVVQPSVPGRSQVYPNVPPTPRTIPHHHHNQLQPPKPLPPPAPPPRPSPPLRLSSALLPIIFPVTRYCFCVSQNKNCAVSKFTIILQKLS